MDRDPADELGAPLCSDEDFAKLTGGCLYRGHFPDHAALKEMFARKIPTGFFTCPKCLKTTKYDIASGMIT